MWPKTFENVAHFAEVELSSADLLPNIKLSRFTKDFLFLIKMIIRRGLQMHLSGFKRQAVWH